MIIYKITNLINSKIYIGQTIRTLEDRILQHQYDDLYVDRAIKKYGWDNFKAEVIEECETIEKLNEREMYWIKELNSKAPNGYNLTDGGEGTPNLYNKKTHDEYSEIARRREASKTPAERSERVRKAWAGIPFEIRSEKAKQRAARRTPAERSETARRREAAKRPEERAAGARMANAMRTHEERSEIAKKRESNKTPEQRNALANWMASRTPEERSSIARKREENKRKKKEIQQLNLDFD